MNSHLTASLLTFLLLIDEAVCLRRICESQEKQLEHEE